MEKKIQNFSQLDFSKPDLIFSSPLGVVGSMQTEMRTRAQLPDDKWRTLSAHVPFIASSGRYHHLFSPFARVVRFGTRIETMF